MHTLSNHWEAKQVNHCEMFDLGVTKDQEIECQKQEEEKNEEEDKNQDLPLYQPSITRKKDFIQHPYNLRPRDRKMVNTRTMLVSTCL